MDNQILTFGQKAVGVSFNPSKNPDVDRIKQVFANAIDQMDAFRKKSESAEAKRYASIAITDAESACMRAVKALTWEA